MVIEEYGTELVYVPGEDNIVTDTLSRQDTAVEALEGKEEAFLSEELYLNRHVFEDKSKCPIDFKVLNEDQETDSDLKKTLKDVKDKEKFRKKTFGDIEL